MKVVWNNKTYQLKLTKKNKPGKNKSGLHLNIREYLKSNYPHHIIYEEVRLPGVKLSVDFFMPELSVMIEAQGKQHYEYVKHFHQNRLGWLSSRQRDLQKKKWCELNQIRLIEVKYDRWEKDIIDGLK
jgi:hypothetical protein